MIVLAAATVATLVWGSRAWLMPALIVTAIGMAAIWWGYSRTSGPRSVRLAAATLKAIALSLLAAVLLDPLWASQRARPGENVVLLLVDTSQSMQVHSHDRGPSPAQMFAKRLGDDRQPWLVRLRQDFDVRSYTFDRRLEPCNDLDAIAFDGSASRLHAAIESLGERYAGRPVAGIVLMTDGVSTDGVVTEGLTAEQIKHLPPIYPVLPPETVPAADVSLTNITSTQTNFEDAPVTLMAEARCHGEQREPLVAQVVDESNKVVLAEEQLPTGDGAPVAFRFQFRPEHDQLSFYRVRVAAKSQAEVWSHPETSCEATLANNQRWVAVDRGRGPLRILYVGGART